MNSTPDYSVPTEEETELEQLLRSGPTTAEKLRRLPWSVAWDAANSFSVRLTFYGSGFVLMLNQLGFDKSQIGYILSLLPFLVVVALFTAPLQERLGNKRTFVGFWGLRTVVTAAMLLVPLIYTNYGSWATLIYIALVTAGFSIFRAVAISALLPWQQEYIPAPIRGRLAAYTNMASSATGLVAVTFAGFILGRSSGLTGYMILFAGGVFFGAVATWAAGHLPGGSPESSLERKRSPLQALLRPLVDRNFMLYLLSASLVTLAIDPVAAFQPLYLHEQIGLSDNLVVFITNGVLIGGMLSSFFWGWAADRYGSKPVLVTGLVLTAAYPLMLIFIPPSSMASFPVAMLVSFYFGIATFAQLIGSARLVVTSIIPAQGNASFSAFYNAWLGVVSGTAAIIAGHLLDRYSGFQLPVRGFELSAYVLLFIAATFFILASLVVLSRVRAEGSVTVGEFAGMFYQGNPLLAVDSMIRFRMARDETTTISVTERLGRSRSPLTAEELLEALDDPRFYVRFEALISIGRYRSEPRLLARVEEILNGSDPALGVIAAWALGRLGETGAIPALRQALSSPYRSIQAHAARSLGALDDQESVPILLERLRESKDLGLQVAYAAALGRLQAEAATGDLLRLLYQSPTPQVQMEVALAVARLTGRESSFIQLLRQVRLDRDTALSQAVSGLVHRQESPFSDPVLREHLAHTAEQLAHGELEDGLNSLAVDLQDLHWEDLPTFKVAILQECARRINEFGASRLEYAILVLHCLREI